MKAYYNENEPYAAAWLRNLIAAGHLPTGDVDERSILEVTPDDLKGYTQAHFFAGIGGWPLALRLAGWADDRPVWTGSCPCQPFSSAGSKIGHADERNLWPHWFGLIRERRPATIFGEQVAGAIAFGWMDEVFNDLEKEAYSGAAGVLPACSIGAPHKRDRLWFVAHAAGADDRGKGGEIRGEDGRPLQYDMPESGGTGQSGILADAGCGRLGEPEKGKIQQQRGTEAIGAGEYDYVANAAQFPEREQAAKTVPIAISGKTRAESGNGSNSSLEWIECPDGKARPVKPGIRLLVDGFSNRVACLKAGGNAVQVEVATQFIKAFMEII